MRPFSSAESSGTIGRMDSRKNSLYEVSEDLHEIVVEEVDEATVETIQLLNSFGVSEDVISALIGKPNKMKFLCVVI